jgi:hypothetical protein
MMLIRIKDLQFFIIIIFATIRLSAQTNIKDASIVFSTELTNIMSEPTSTVLKTSYSIKKFLNGKQGIEFSFLIRPQKDMPQVNLDSIILSSSDYKILAVHKPYFDTSYALMDMNMSYSTVHWLDETAVRFLQDEMISEIILFVDKSPITIRLNKKSQKKLNADAKLNL